MKVDKNVKRRHDFEYVYDFEQMRTALDFWLLIFDTMISYSISG